MKPDHALQVDLREVRGQSGAKRAMEIAAAGGHHIVLVGPGGCGKTMLARAFATTLPRVGASERQHVSDTGTISGDLGMPSPIIQPPVICPPPSTSPRRLHGGRGKGDLVLADTGVLILDDAERFSAPSLALIRETLDRGEVRSGHGVSRSARFQLFATVRCCPCGEGFGFYRSPCGDGRSCQTKHQWRAVKWFIDVADVQMMMEVNHAGDWGGFDEETSTQVAARVASAKSWQDRRGNKNAELSGQELMDVCVLPADASRLLDQAMSSLFISGRDATAVLRVARTIADLEGAENLSRGHLAEALIYRFLRPRYEQPRNLTRTG